MDHSEDFENGKLFPMIVRYSVPAAISLLITAIYNIVDRIFVGNYCGTSAWRASRSAFRCLSS